MPCEIANVTLRYVKGDNKYEYKLCHSQWLASYLIILTRFDYLAEHNSYEICKKRYRIILVTIKRQIR